VDVPVACVEDVRHPHAVPFADRRDLAEHGRQLGAGDDGILVIVVSGHSPERARGGLAPLPEQRPLGFGPGHLEVQAPVRAACCLDLHSFRRDLRLEALQLDQQDGPRVQGIARLRVRLDGLRRLWSIISSATGMMPRPMMAETALLASSIVERPPGGLHRLRGGRSRTVTSVQMPSVPSDPTKTP
jgi:hypothetical protein